MDLPDWLEQHGLAKYTDVFVDNDVDMDVLPSLTEDDLKELGVSLGHRRKLQALLSQTQPAEPAKATVEADPTENTQTPYGRSSQTAEHRQLTVMFCDLANSTSLSQSLEVEAYRSLILSYQDLCSHAVQSFEGHLARLFGDGVLVYFGYPVAHEDDAERAVRAAMLIHDSLEGLTAGTTNVSARIGIATGAVVVGDIIGEGASQQSTALGETPNLAARLQSIAQPGCTVVADSSRRLMHGQFEFAAMGTQQFKGIENPVNAWQLVSEQFVDSRFDSTRGASMTEIIGREEEIDTLWRRWLQSADGHGQVAVVSGEAGIGKSRVVRGLQDRLNAVDHCIVSVQSSQHHSGTPLFPFVTQINRAAKITAEDSVSSKCNKIDQLFSKVKSFDSTSRAALLDLLSISNTDTESDEVSPVANAREVILQTIVNYVHMHCLERPALFVIEDVQWIDPTSIDLIDLLVASAVSMNMMIIITHRSERDYRWTGEAHVTSMLLNKLPSTMCDLLIQKTSGNKKLPAELVREILDKTDGVPLFIEELTTTIIESGMVRAEGDHYVLDQPITSLAIPMTIQDSLMARLDRLSSVKDLAQIGSVIGREFSHELLASVAAVPDVELLEGLNRLIDAGLIFKRHSANGVTYMFKHAMVQDTAYESMLISRRKQIHARISHSLEQHFPSVINAQPEMMARHLNFADFPEKSISFWQIAASQALSRSQMREAWSHTRNALKTLTRLPLCDTTNRLKFELLMSQITPLVAVEGYTTQSIETLYAEAMPLYQTLHTSVDVYPLLFARWIRFLNLGEMQAALDQADEIQSVATNNNSPLMLGLAARLTGSVQLLFKTPGEAIGSLAIVTSLIDEERSNELGFKYGQDTLVATWTNQAMALCSIGQFEQGLARAEETLQRAEQLQHALAVAFANGHLALVHIMTGDAKRLRRCCENIERANSAQPMPAWVAVADGCRAALKLMQGDTADALVSMSAAINTMNTLGTRIWLSIWLALQARCYVAAEQPEQAAVVIDNALQHIADGGGTWPEAEFYRLRALVGQATGCPDSSIVNDFNYAIDTAQKAGNCIFWLNAALDYARYLHGNKQTLAARQQLQLSIDAVDEPCDVPIYNNAVHYLQSLTT